MGGVRTSNDHPSKQSNIILQCRGNYLYSLFSSLTTATVYCTAPGSTGQLGLNCRYSISPGSQGQPHRKAPISSPDYKVLLLYNNTYLTMQHQQIPQPSKASRHLHHYSSLSTYPTSCYLPCAKSPLTADESSRTPSSPVVTSPTRTE